MRMQQHGYKVLFLDIKSRSTIPQLCLIQMQIKACKERQELCQYILDFMIKAKQQNDIMAAKSGPQNTAVKPQNAPQSISTHSMANTIGKEQLEQLELVLGLDATISFCRAALILELPEFGPKEALLGTLKDFASKRS